MTESGKPRSRHKPSHPLVDADAYGAWPRHPRLSAPRQPKSWVTGPSPVMTNGEILPIRRFIQVPIGGAPFRRHCNPQRRHMHRLIRRQITCQRGPRRGGIHHHCVGKLSHRGDTAPMPVSLPRPSVFGEFQRDHVMNHRHESRPRASQRTRQSGRPMQMPVRNQQINSRRIDRRIAGKRSPNHQTQRRPATIRRPAVGPRLTKITQKHPNRVVRQHRKPSGPPAQHDKPQAIRRHRQQSLGIGQFDAVDPRQRSDAGAFHQPGHIQPDGGHATEAATAASTIAWTRVAAL